jgi:RNA polymerase II-associated factor 1
LGLDGELEKWTRYKPFNAIETNYSWKLHTESDLGVPLAPSAMDLETCYVDPSKPRKKQKHDYEDMFDDDDLDPSQNKIKLPPLHPDDAALINWKGSLGDTTAEQLQIRRDRARAAALLQGFNGGKNVSSSPSLLAFQQLRMNNQKGPKDFRSRVLNEQNPFFMKKTTYLANDQSQSVHNFKSLAQTKEMTVEEMEKMLVHSKKASEEEYIEETFAMTNNNNRPSEKRRHPSKRGVEAVYEIPLLPDVDTWGHVYTHVVLDNLPKKSSILSKLHNALIADVARGNLNSTRMECNLIIPQKNNATTTKLPTEYTIAQLYDLDVIPLKEDGAPHTNFLFVIDEEKQVASYHPIASRVQLSAGRPSQYSNDMDNIKTRLVSKRTLDEEEIAEIEGRKAEVDLDLAKKYGMIVEEEKVNDNDDYEGYGDNVRNQGDDGGNRRIPPFNTGDSSDSDEDAF